MYKISLDFNTELCIECVYYIIYYPYASELCSPIYRHIKCICFYNERKKGIRKYGNGIMNSLCINNGEPIAATVTAIVKKKQIA